MTDVFEQAFFQRLADLAESHSLIDQNLYQKYDIKRGLRYTDGRSVLVSLTRVSDVVGYEKIGRAHV